jgi:hypothetical protein
VVVAEEREGDAGALDVLAGERAMAPCLRAPRMSEPCRRAMLVRARSTVRRRAGYRGWPALWPAPQIVTASERSTASQDMLRKMCTLAGH